MYFVERIFILSSNEVGSFLNGLVFYIYLVERPEVTQTSKQTDKPTGLDRVIKVQLHCGTQDVRN